MSKLNWILTTIISLLCCFEGCTQPIAYKTFVNSFKEFKEDNVIEFAELINTTNPVTKKDAINFIYAQDSSRLYCTQKIVNMETEKVNGVLKELYLPNKYFRIATNSYILLIYSTYECNPLDNQVMSLLNLTILNNDYKKTDSLIAYKGNDYDYVIKGLLNPVTKNILLITVEHGKKNAALYKIDNATKKFVKIKDSKNVVGDTSDLKKILESLDWVSIF